MQIWLDTADLDEIQKAAQMNMLFGVTTNPTILASAKQSPLQSIEHILKIQNGPVAVQVTLDSIEGMISQARELHRLSERIIVKVPVTSNGLQAMNLLHQENIATMATAILSPHKVLLAGLSHAKYAAFYLSVMDQEIGGYKDSLKTMIDIIEKQKLTATLLAASIKNLHQITVCAALGVPSITLPPAVFSEFVGSDHHTLAFVERFQRDWQKSYGEAFLVG